MRYFVLAKFNQNELRPSVPNKRVYCTVAFNGEVGGGGIHERTTPGLLGPRWRERSGAIVRHKFTAPNPAPLPRTLHRGNIVRAVATRPLLYYYYYRRRLGRYTYYTHTHTQSGKKGKRTTPNFPLGPNDKDDVIKINVPTTGTI